MVQVAQVALQVRAQAGRLVLMVQVVQVVQVVLRVQARVDRLVLMVQVVQVVLRVQARVDQLDLMGRVDRQEHLVLSFRKWCIHRIPLLSLLVMMLAAMFRMFRSCRMETTFTLVK